VSDDANPGAIEIHCVIAGSVCHRAAGFYYAAFEGKRAFAAAIVFSFGRVS
tara:strand:+ start:214 stop:366 length:153 start_codon:yes stop_codon:yes gene_type:complete